MNRSAKAVKRKDHLRVLLTETSPYEVPAIFSNIGFIIVKEVYLRLSYKTLSLLIVTLSVLSVLFCIIKNILNF